MKNKIKNRKLKMIDLFSGCGGLTLGFTQNGFNPVETVEHWQPAVDTYNHNFNRKCIAQDITNLQLRQKIEKKWKNKIDLVIGGFPCQGYSMSGRRDKADPRNQLYKYTLDIIKRVKPKFFVLENVKGILSFKESDGILVIEKIKSMLLDIGYYSNQCLLDASLFGVPQKRERVIFIGAPINDKEKVEKCIQLLLKHKEPIRSVKDAISDLENLTENTENNHIFTNHSKEMIKKITKTPEGGCVMKSFSDAFKKVWYDKPSPTIKENHGGVHVHPKFNRVMTPRELARLQTFPDDFIFKSTKSNILKQIGNAVPVKLSNEIAKIVKKVFNE